MALAWICDIDLTRKLKDRHVAYSFWVLVVTFRMKKWFQNLLAAYIACIKHLHATWEATSRSGFMDLGLKGRRRSSDHRHLTYSCGYKWAKNFSKTANRWILAKWRFFTFFSFAGRDLHCSPSFFTMSVFPKVCSSKCDKYVRRSAPFILAQIVLWTYMHMFKRSWIRVPKKVQGTIP